MRPGGLFTRVATAVGVPVRSKSHRSAGGNTVNVRYEKRNPLSSFSEMGAFPLLYPYRDDIKPFDRANHLDYKNSRATVSSVYSIVTGIMVNLYHKMGKTLISSFCKTSKHNELLQS